MREKTLRTEDLDCFTGTENYYQQGFGSAMSYTDGVKYVAETGGAYWLIDEIALTNRFNENVRAQPFQVWTLTVGKGETTRLTCEDGNGNEVYAKRIGFTDFPLPEITFWCVDGVIVLPSEN